MGRCLSTLGAALVLALAWSVPANAVVDGTPPQSYQTFQVFGGTAVLGNTLMGRVPSRPEVNSFLISSSEAEASTIPVGSSISGAYLFWSGSTTDSGPDRRAQLTFPNGRRRNIDADRCITTTGNFGGTDRVDFFYCRADVTSQLAANPASASDYRGRYAVGGVQARAGELADDGTCEEPNVCQAMYAGWSLVIVYEDPSENTLRDIVLFDGFRLLDETPFSDGIDRFTITGFDVADPPEAYFTFFGLEGDALLGVPPQDSDPVFGCDTCFDYISFNGTKLSDPNNPEDNIWNSTTPAGGALGIDIDTFDISSLVRPGTRTARIEIGSGDGDTSTGQAGGGGELVFMGYVMLTINRRAPDFRSSNTFKSVDPSEAGPGETLFYTVNVTNDGSQNATNVVLRDAIPAGTSYVAGSTRVDDAAVGDVGGTSPLVSGLSLGTVPFSGTGSTRRITFRATVNSDAAAGSLITNSAVISSSELPDVETNTVTTRVEAPELGQPDKSFVDLNGGSVEPGDRVRYDIEIVNDSGRTASGITFVDDMSPYVQLEAVFASGFTDESVFSGGANGTGRVEVSDVLIPVVTERAYISYTVQVLSVEELVAKGVSAADVDGLLVTNQGTVSAPFLATPLRTDDPTTRPSPDATEFRLSSPVNFFGDQTAKTVRDINGGQPEPGDRIEYSLQVGNAGTQPARINLSDNIPAGLVDVTVAGPGFVTYEPAPAGAFGSGLIGVINREVEGSEEFLITISGVIAEDAENGLVIQNQATLSVVDHPDQNQNLISEPLVVVAGPDFADATKVVQGPAGGFQPGDRVSYDIEFSNQGNQPSGAVTVTDPVDPLLTNVTVTGGSFNPSTRTVTWSLSDVAVDGTVTLQFEADIVAGATNGAIARNQATITSATGDWLTDDPSTSEVDDSTDFQILALGDLSVTKEAIDTNGGAFEPGDAIQYRITLLNQGRSAATNIVVTDTLDTDLLIDVALVNGRLVGSQGTWDPTTVPALASLEPSGRVELLVNAQIRPGISDGTEISNQALAVSPTIVESVLSDDPRTAEADDPTIIIINADPVLTDSLKTVTDENGGEAQPGDVLTYTVTVVNTGTGAARNVTISDPVDANLVDIVPADGGVYDSGSRQISWSLPGAVAPNESAEVHFEATISASAVADTVIANQATIRALDLAEPAITDDPTTPADDDSTDVVVRSQPDFVTSTKTVADVGGDGLFEPGEAVVYSLVITNTGTQAGTSIVVRDEFPVELTNLDIDGGSVEGDEIVWRLDSLPAGESTGVGFRGDLISPLDNGLVVSNQAFVTSAEVADPTPTDDPSTDEVDDATLFEVFSEADLTASLKTVTLLDGEPARPTGRVAYAIQLFNTGTSAASNVVVTDQVDPSLTNIVPSDGTYDDLFRVITWNVGDLDPTGDTPVTLTFTAEILSPLDNGTLVENQAFIAYDGALDPIPTDDPATVEDDDPNVFQVISSFDFSDALKAVNDDGGLGYRPGDTVTYTMGFSNRGDSAARNVVVTDRLPPELTLVDAAGAQVEGDAVVWRSSGIPELAEVNPGDEISLSLTALINSPLPNGTVVLNQAEVSADRAAAPFLTDDPTTAEEDDPTSFEVTSEPNLSGVTKTVLDLDDDGLFEPLDELEYTIGVINSGDDSARTVRVEDEIPAELQDVVVLDGGRIEGNRVVWDSGGTPGLTSVATENPVSLRFRATVRPDVADGTVIDNQAQVSAENHGVELTDDPATGLGDDDPTSVQVVSQPRLDTSTKTVTDLNGGDFEPGDSIEYTIEVENAGSQTARNVRVTDVINASLFDVETVPDATLIDGELIWDLGDLRPRSSLELTIRATISSETSGGTAIANQAFISGTGLFNEPTDDPTTDEEDDPTEFSVQGDPDFSLSTKTVSDLNGGFVEPGDELLWTIQVENSGQATALGVRVVDTVDSSSLLIGNVGSDGGVLGSEIVWSDVSSPGERGILPGDVVELAFTTTVLDSVPNSTRVANQAEISDFNGLSWVTDDPGTPEPSDPTVTVVLFPELDRATKRVTDLNGDGVSPGDRLEYEITIDAGNGPDLTDVVITDQLDASLGDPELVDGGSFDTATREIRFGAESIAALRRVPSGSTVSFRYQVDVADDAVDGQQIINQAFITSSEVPEGVLSDDPTNGIGDDDPTIVEVESDEGPSFAQSTKSVDLMDGSGSPGERVRYTIDVTNSGRVVAETVLMHDLLPEFVSYVPGTLIINDAEVEDGGFSPLPAGVSVGRLAPAESARVSFEAEVSEDAPVGSVVSNSAMVSDAGRYAAPTDDPTTPAQDDPTRFVVGSGPILDGLQKLAEPTDENGNGAADIGETVVYTIVVPNDGTEPATGLLFEDVIADNATYVAGSLTIDGRAATDEVDDDAAEVVGTALSVRFDEIVARTTRTIQFTVVVDSGSELENQGRLTSRERPLELTDSNASELDGDQPTIVPVGNQSVGLLLSKTAVNPTGQPVGAGGRLQYVITAQNTGAEFGSLALTDRLSGALVDFELLAGPDGTSVEDAVDGVSIALDRFLAPNEEVSFLFSATLADSVADGVPVCNQVEGSLVSESGDESTAASESVCFDAGGLVTVASLDGVVFLDVAGDPEAFEQDLDRGLDDFLVELSTTGGLVVASVSSDTAGEYAFPLLEDGVYSARLLTHGGRGDGSISLGEHELTLQRGSAVARDLFVDPSGVVYQSETGEGVDGVRAYLHYGPDDPSCAGLPDDRERECLVLPEDLLEAAQQGQLTHDGFYRFDVSPGHTYRLDFDPGIFQLSFPSTAIPPYPTTLAASEETFVVPNAFPDISPGAELIYYLLFDIETQEGEVKNNHVPLDPSSDRILLDKRASRRSAVVGDVVTYTVTVTNQSSGDLTYDPEQGLGGANVVDLIPAPFRFVEGSARTRLILSDGTEQTLTTNVSGHLVLTFAEEGEEGGPQPFSIPADSQLELRYQLVIGSDTEPGYEYENLAELRSGDGSVLLSNRDAASVRVVYDPVFDQGFVVGKVYCDDNNNGAQDEGEDGLVGARIYLDTGYYADGDAYGRYHFDNIDPGTHLLKLDEHSLPVGSAITTDQRRVIWVTRGTPSLIDFGVSCPDNRVFDVSVSASPELEAEVVRLRAERYIEVSGDLGAGTLRLDDQEFSLPTCWLDASFGEVNHAVLARDAIRDPMEFSVRTSSGSGWAVSVHDRAGDTLWMHRGSGSSETVTWDGLAEDGTLALEAGAVYRAVLRSRAGDTRCSTQPVFFGAARPTPEWMFERTFETEGYRGARLRTALRREIEEFAPELLEYSDEMLTVEVHHDDSLPPAESLELTQARADAAAAIVSEVIGRDLADIQVIGFGGSRPLVPNIGDRNRRTNRRLVVGVGDPRPVSEPPRLPPVQEQTPGVVVGGTALELTLEGTFGGYVRRPQAAEVEVEVHTEGARIRVTGENRRPDVQSEEPEEEPTPASSDEPEPVEEEPEDTPPAEESPSDEEPEPDEPTDDGQDGDDEFIEPLTTTFLGIGGLNLHEADYPFAAPGDPARQPRFRVELAQTDEFEELGEPATGGETPPVDAPPVRTQAPERAFGDNAPASGEPVRNESGPQTSGEGAELPRDAGLNDPVRVMESIEDLTPEELDRVLTGRVTLQELMNLTPASRLEVNLPPAGAILNRHELTVWGQTYPGNRLTINELEVPVDGEGRFRYLATLPSGQSVITVETLDQAGNRGILEWPVEVAPVRYFLMALGDGAVGTRGAHLDGLNDHNSTTTDSDIFHLLYGTARVYFKMWVSGEELLDGAFDEIAVTAYIDTARQREYEEFVDQVIEPDRYYAVYGDSSEQVDDIETQGKLYVLVTADESSARWGTIETQIQGVEHLRYERTLQGAQLVVNETFAEDYETELRAHWADDENALRQSVDYLRGTGGSLYYLRHDEVIEGSDRVSLVVRDRTSGIELYRRRLSRNEDYTVRHQEGRLMMMTPIPSTVDSNFIVSDTATTRDPLVGHVVYLEVGYEYEGETDFGSSSAAVHARETFDEWLSLGGGYIREGRSENADAPYELWGVEAGLRHGDRTRLDFEYVQSQNTDTAAEYSDDGGLTFERFNTRDDTGAEGSGIHLSGGAEVADIFDSIDDEVFYLGGYYDDLDAGFYSGSSVMDQGSTRFGGEARWVASERNTVRIEHDGSNTIFENLATIDDDSREVNRQTSLAQYLYNAGDLRLTLEYAHTFYDDNQEEDGYNSDVAAAGFAFDVIDDLTLSIDQEVIARSDDPMILRQTAAGDELDPSDRFTTGVSASYRLLDTVEIRASERIRYSGETSTSVGLRTAFSDDIDIYIQDRFETYRDRSGTTNSVVVGGENRYGHDGSGRSYAEYQVQDGITGETNRALMGVGQRFEIVDGLTGDAAYEHTQISDPRFGGESTRDSGSLGLEYLGLDWLKVSSRFEVRLDDGNSQSPRTNPCETSGVEDNPRFCRDMLPDGTDRLQVTTANGIDLVPIPDVTLVLRYLYSNTDDMTLEETVARTTEASFGAAYRPIAFSWVTGLVRYTYLDDLRPVAFGSEESERESSHVLSIVPIANLDRWGFQLVEKLAFRRSELHVAGLPATTNDMFLWINRVNYHLTGQIDASLEYRMLTQSLANDSRSGFLLEASYILEDYVRLGLGYNFTDFTDNELGDFSQDESGVFFRVTGQY